MTLTTRFGVVDYNEEDRLDFPSGLVGMPDLRSFVLLEHKPGSPFRWLQSVDEPSVSVLVVDPWAYVPEYQPEIRDGDLQGLNVTQESPPIVFTTVSIPKGKPEAMTLNLFGPIVINLMSRVGKQVTLDDSAYTIRYRVFPKANSGGGQSAEEAA